MLTVVGVTTHNPLALLRLDLLRQTITSIETAFPTAILCLLSNGSDDDSHPIIVEMCGERWTTRHARVSDRDDLIGAEGATWSPGAGRIRLLEMMSEAVWRQIGRSPDGPGTIMVWSDDDMVWREGAQKTLERFWETSTYPRHPTGIDVLSGLLEPVWHWNTPREAVEHNGVRVLVRDSAPGAAFSFIHHQLVCPHDPEEATFGYDHKVCRRLIGMGSRVAQIDLAVHNGDHRSTHGNRAWDHVDTKPLDREHWGV